MEVARLVVPNHELVYVVELVLSLLCYGRVVATARLLLLAVAELGNDHPEV